MRLRISPQKTVQGPLNIDQIVPYEVRDIVVTTLMGLTMATGVRMTSIPDETVRNIM